MVSSINAALDILSAVFLSIIFLDYIFKRKIQTRRNKIFFSIVVFTLTALVLDAIGWKFDGVLLASKDENPFLFYLSYVITYGSTSFAFMSGYSILFLFNLYILDLLEDICVVNKIHYYILYSVYFLAIVFMFINAVPGLHLIFKYDIENKYHAFTIPYVLSQGLGVFLLFYCVVLMISNRKKFNHGELLSFMSFLLFPFLGFVGKLGFQYPYSLMYICAALSIFVFLINFNNIQIGEGVIDQATGLDNKLAYNRRLNSTYKSLISCGVMFFDINNLKGINDEFGHTVGDEIILRMATSLKQLLTPFIHGYRYGGDEFIVLMMNCEEQDVKEFIEKWHKIIDELNKDYEIKIYSSVGYAYDSSEDIDVDQLVKDADLAMYNNKRKAR